MADNMAGLNIQYGQVGPRTPMADGQFASIRLDETGSVIIRNRGGLYSEAIKRGNVYAASVKSFTVVAAGTSPVPATTATVTLGLLNPLGSTKKLSILKIGISSVSGTPAGPFYWDIVNSPAPALTTTQTQPLNLLTLQSAGSVARVYAGASTGALVAAGTMVRPLGGSAAISLGAGIANTDEFIEGTLELPPNSLGVIGAHGAGTTHVVSGYIVWEEIPV